MSLKAFFEDVWNHLDVHGFVLLIDVLFVLVLYNAFFLLGPVIVLPMLVRAGALLSLFGGVFMIYSVLRLLVLRWLGVRASWRRLVARLFAISASVLILLFLVVQVFFSLRNLFDQIVLVFVVNVVVFVAIALILFFTYILFQRLHKKPLVGLVADLAVMKTYRPFWSSLATLAFVAVLIALVHVLLKAFVFTSVLEQAAYVRYGGLVASSVSVVTLYVLHAYHRWCLR